MKFDGFIKGKPCLVALSLFSFHEIILGQSAHV